MNKLIYISTLLLITLQGWSQTEEKIALNKGIESYKKGEFSEALTYFNKANVRNPDYKKAIFNAANAALLIDSTQIAKDLYQEYATTIDDKIEKSKAYYNLGNTQYKEYEKLAKDPQNAQKSTEILKESIESYKKSLRNNYKDKDARYNLSLAMSKLPPENDQNQQDDQNKEGEDNKDNKDQDNKNNDQKDGEKDNQSEGEKDGKKDDDNNDKGKQEDNKDGESDKDKEGEKEEDKEEKENKSGQQGEEDKKKAEEEMRGKISRMQAQKDLDAMNNDEQKTLIKVNRKKGNQKKENSSSKDW